MTDWSPRPYGVAPPGFMLPDATRVGGVTLQVSDLSRSIDYYRRVIGLDVLDEAGDAASLGPAGSRRPLVELRAKPGIAPASRHGAFGLYHFAIVVPGREHLGRFLRHLARDSTNRLGMADHLVSEAFYLWDPDGLGIEVYADRPRETWRYHGRELAMASDPLDTDSLIAAAGEDRWTGMPAGTRMGHMHLHVGDLARAEAFYHAALGLEKMVWSYPGALFLAAGGYHHHLGVNTWSRGPSATDAQARLLSWGLLVPAPEDVDRVAESLTTHGVAATHDGDALTTADPWGTRLRVTIDG